MSTSAHWQPKEAHLQRAMKMVTEHGVPGATYLDGHQGYCSICITKINQVWMAKKWRETAPLCNSMDRPEEHYAK